MCVYNIWFARTRNPMEEFPDMSDQDCGHPKEVTYILHMYILHIKSLFQTRLTFLCPLESALYSQAHYFQAL